MGKAFSPWSSLEPLPHQLQRLVDCQGSLGVSETGGCVTIQPVDWTSVTFPKRGSQEGDESGFLLSHCDGPEQRLGRLLMLYEGCGGVCGQIMPMLRPSPPPCLLGLRPLLWFFPASGPGEIKWANALSQGCFRPLHSPTVGILGEGRGRALEAIFSQVQALESPGQW